jgi:hypothetical protein
MIVHNINNEPLKRSQIFIEFTYTHLLHGAESFKKLTGSQPVKKFPAFYGTRRFITAFSSAQHLPLS